MNIWIDATKRRLERAVRYKVELDERLKRVYSKKIRRIEDNRKAVSYTHLTLPTTPYV